MADEWARAREWSADRPVGERRAEQVLVIVSIAFFVATAASLFVLDWFRVGDPSYTPGFDLDLRNASTCAYRLDQWCSQSLSDVSHIGEYPKFATMTFLTHCAFAMAVFWQVGRRIISEVASKRVAWAGALIGVIGLVCIILAGYVFPPDYDRSFVRGAPIHHVPVVRTWAPVVLAAADALGLFLVFLTLRSPKAPVAKSAPVPEARVVSGAG